MLNSGDASARLLRSPIKSVQRAALFGLAGNRKHRGDVKACLSSDDPGVLIRAMEALAATDSDWKHAPKGGDSATLDPGSFNAKMLEYWRNKK